MSKLEELTQERLKELVSYNPETGVFQWKVQASSKTKIGSRAGSFCKPIGYRHIKIDKKSYPEHRLAWLYVYGEWPKCIDHINRKRDDNRLANLRSVTTAENSKNMPAYKSNKSGVVGVMWYKAKNKWTAQISASNKRKSLGYFEDKFEAICARKSAEAKLGFHHNHGKIMTDEWCNSTKEIENLK